MKTKFSKIIYHDHQSRSGITHFSVGINLKTLILAGVVPDAVPFEKRRMYHAHLFISVFTIEITAIL